jgi:hypothetical protein
MRRFVLVLFPALLALASVVALAAVSRSDALRARLGRLDLRELFESVRPHPVQIDSVQP